MGVAVPFLTSMIAGTVVSKFVGKITGNEKLAMLAGFGAGAWAGGQAGQAMAGGGTTTAPTGDVLPGGAMAEIGPPPGYQEPGLLSKTGGWVEANPVKSQMLLGAAQGMGAQSMQKDLLEEQRRADEERYVREHQAVDPSEIRSLEDVNRGLIAGGYQSPGTRLRSPDLPNYQQLLQSYRNN